MAYSRRTSTGAAWIHSTLLWLRTVADAYSAGRHCVVILNPDIRYLRTPCQLWLLVGVHHWLSGFQPAHLVWPSNLPLVMVWKIFISTTPPIRILLVFCLALSGSCFPLLSSHVLNRYIFFLFGQTFFEVLFVTFYK